jgi:hypothetical protein
MLASPENVVLGQHLERVANQLTRQYHDRATESEVRQAVYSEASQYHHARVTQFIPVLVAHSVGERLRRRVPL